MLDPVYACRGLVATPHYLASLAGYRVLRQGGNAFDAAVAACAALSVVYPHMTGPGGDAFWLLYPAAEGRPRALNASGPAARRARPEAFASQGRIPERGPQAVLTVPGAVAAWGEVQARYGRLPLPALLEEAIELARHGFPVSAGLARWLALRAPLLAQDPAARAAFLPEGRPPRAGELLRLPGLARTLEAIAGEGAEAFYRGPVAVAMVAYLREQGGLLEAEDLAAYRPRWEEPIRTTYRGLEACQCGPNSQGLAHLIMLNLLEGLDLAAMGEGSASWIRAVVEATRLAFALRDRYLGDPDFVAVPVAQLLDKGEAERLRDRAGPEPLPAGGPPPGGDTVCVVAADGEGNAACAIQSLYHEFGSGVVAGETGVLLHNRGCFFSLDPHHPNSLQPGKRPAHTLMPGMLLRDGRPYLVYGTMGGEGQPQTATILVTRVVDFGLDVQAAIAAPRWVWGRTWGEARRDLRLEARFPPEVQEELRRLGYPVVPIGAWDEAVGHAQAIRILEAGVLEGGTDPRAEGAALGW